MATLAEELTALKTEEDKITGNKVANFSYDDYAYEHNDANGVDTYNVDAHQNIPNGTASILKVNATILTKGWRAQASAITRMLMNHFLGRCSYNLNKVNDHFSALLTKLLSYLGVANGIATLDANGKVPVAQINTAVANGIASLDSNIKLPLNQLPNHASSSTAYGVASTSNYGHVKKGVSYNSYYFTASQDKQEISIDFLGLAKIECTNTGVTSIYVKNTSGTIFGMVAMVTARDGTVSRIMSFTTPSGFRETIPVPQEGLVSLLTIAGDHDKDSFIPEI